MSKRPVSHAFSAGGVVFRQADDAADGLYVALVGRTRERVWTLPKGTPAQGESREMTALREVREESGIDTRIIGEVGALEYAFIHKGRLVKKQVFHYLMLAVGGDLAAHDHEYDEARWFQVEDAIRNLSYENEADIVRKAAQLMRAWLAKSPEERAEISGARADGAL